MKLQICFPNLYISSLTSIYRLLVCICVCVCLSLCTVHLYVSVFICMYDCISLCVFPPPPWNVFLYKVSLTCYGVMMFPSSTPAGRSAPYRLSWQIYLFHRTSVSDNSPHSLIGGWEWRVNALVLTPPTCHHFTKFYSGDTRVIKIHPLGARNVWHKFYVNPSHTYLRYFNLGQSGPCHYINNAAWE